MEQIPDAPWIRSPDSWYKIHRLFGTKFEETYETYDEEEDDDAGD